MDTPYDVFIVFHAPWCGHCRKLEPTWRELAEKLKDVETLVVAKIDATRNEVPGVRLFYAGVSPYKDVFS